MSSISRRFIALGAFVLVFAVVVGVALAATAPSEDLAAGKRAIDSDEHSPFRAIDGDDTTYWQAPGDLPQVWRVDLGAVEETTGFQATWLKPEGQSRVTGYRLTGSADGADWFELADRSGSSSPDDSTDSWEPTKLRYLRVHVLSVSQPELGPAGAYEFHVWGLDGAPATEPTPTPTPSSTAGSGSTPEPTPSPTPSTPDRTDGPRLGILTAYDIATLRSRIASGRQPELGAWQYLRDNQLRTAMSADPNVDPGPTTTFSYTKLDNDSRHARHAAIGYAASGELAHAAKARQFVVAWARGNTPASYTHTRDFQGGYHQAYGAFTFAFAYDLTKDSGVYSASDHAAAKAWFATWAVVMKGYQDNWASDWVFTQQSSGDMQPYRWNPSGGLRYSRYDHYMGSDTTLAPMSAWLAAAIVSDHPSLATLYSAGYKLNVQDALHASCAPRNDGDARGTKPVPQVLVHVPGYNDNPERGGNLDYMSYNARLASMLYQMSAAQGRATPLMRTELKASWTYLSKFAGPGYERPVAPNDVIHWDIYLSRMQMAYHLFGDQLFADDVNGGQLSRARFYESQFIGHTTLTQIAP